MKSRTRPTIDFGKAWQAEGPVQSLTRTTMKPIVLAPRQRREIERRCKATLDRRVYQRLTAVLAVAKGNSREEAADLLGVGLSQLGEWLRVFRNQGLDALCTLHYKGDPGKLTPHQVEQLKAEVSTGCFRNSDQIRHWLFEAFHVVYSPSGVKDLLRRIDVSYHKVTGFLWKADPDKQKAFVKKYERQKANARRQEAGDTRRYFVDACHPVWGLDLVFSCWLLVGQRFLVGMGSGRKRLNILGAYCPDDQEYLDLRRKCSKESGFFLTASRQSALLGLPLAPSEESIVRPRPGEYVPDSTEGITRVEDLPKPLLCKRSRSHRQLRRWVSIGARQLAHQHPAQAALFRVT